MISRLQFALFPTFPSRCESLNQFDVLLDGLFLWHGSQFFPRIMLRPGHKSQRTRSGLLTLTRCDLLPSTILRKTFLSSFFLFFLLLSFFLLFPPLLVVAIEITLYSAYNASLCWSDKFALGPGVKEFRRQTNESMTTPSKSAHRASHS